MTTYWYLTCISYAQVSTKHLLHIKSNQMYSNEVSQLRSRKIMHSHNTLTPFNTPRNTSRPIGSIGFLYDHRIPIHSYKDHRERDKYVLSNLFYAMVILRSCTIKSWSDRQLPGGDTVAAKSMKRGAQGSCIDQLEVNSKEGWGGIDCEEDVGSCWMNGALCNQQKPNWAKSWFGEFQITYTIKLWYAAQSGKKWVMSICRNTYCSDVVLICLLLWSQLLWGTNISDINWP